MLSRLTDRRRRGGWALVAGLATVAGPAAAGPPLITDDPGTPGPGHWEINVSGQLEYGPAEVLIAAPDLDVNYGVGESWQLKVEWPLLLTGKVGASPAAAAGNPALGVKWRFLDQSESGIDVSAYPQFDFNPATVKQFGLIDAGTELLLPVELARTIGAVQLYGDLGYDLVIAEPDNVWGGVAALLEVGQRLDLTAEVHAEAPVSFASVELALDGGFSYELDDRFTVLASVGTATFTGGPDVLSYLGLQTHL